MAQTQTLPDPTALSYVARPDSSNTATITRPIPQGIRTWMPALIVLVGMPILALLASKYYMLPSFKRVSAQNAALRASAVIPAPEAPPIFAKISFNSAAGQSAHSGIRGLRLVVANNSIKAQVNQNKAKLTDLAAKDLAGKTAYDFDTPGEADAARAKLLTDINTALGGKAVKDVYIVLWP